jgi:transcriptional regulator with XRE-family HTH domain
MTENSNLPARLRAERIRLGLTQAGLAEALGIPTVTLRSYESGRSEPPARFFSMLMQARVDAHHVVLGKRATEVLAEHIDWQLLAEIARLIGEWSASRPRPLELDEQAGFLRLAYGWASSHGRDSAISMLHDLRKAA